MKAEPTHMSQDTLTPRTDAAAFDKGCDGRDRHPNGTYVESYFARQIERELTAAQRECVEQARLLGMGSEREATLMGKVDRLTKENAELRAKCERLEGALDAEIKLIGKETELLELRMNEERDPVRKEMVRTFGSCLWRHKKSIEGTCATPANHERGAT